MFMKLLKYLPLLLTILFNFTKLHSAFCQIINESDSVKQIYGAHSTRFFYESDLQDDALKLYKIDTSLQAFHQYNYVNKNKNMFTDLGVFGSPMRPIFYQLPKQIGTQFGYDVFKPFHFTPENFTYYDTKSPFTNTHFTLGGGEQMIIFAFTRNIDERNNIGLTYRRINSDKLFGSSNAPNFLGQGELVFADRFDVVLHANHRSKNDKYQMLTHYAFSSHNLFELGGIKTDSTTGLFAYQQSAANLGNSARTWELRNSLYYYHHYELDKLFKIFQNLHYQNIRLDYSDKNLQKNSFFYASNPLAPDLSQKAVFNFDSLTTAEGLKYEMFEQKAGIRGKVKGFYYQAFVRNRFFQTHSNYENLPFLDGSGVARSNIRRLENFIGGKLFYQITDSTRLSIEAEHFLGKDYRLESTLNNPFFQAGFRSVFFSPTILQQRFVSNHHFWINDFKNTLANEVFGSLNIQTLKILFNPFFSYNIIQNFIYFGEDRNPVQSSDLVSLASLGLNFNYQLGKLHTINNWIYTQNLGVNLWRVPAVFINSRLYLEDLFFKDLFHSQIGVEMHYKSAYYADSYNPVNKQFYLQNTFLVNDYLIADLFFNIRLGNVRGFIKLTHANQVAGHGYIPTPIYPGQRRFIGFGVQWLFFN
ncbi:MAG: putative porin [Microscillaceae bacterium]|nr:putative porin [Microscillaceae bacterium]MDW8460671.1 putative porin [Cytophagales bacterium]